MYIKLSIKINIIISIKANGKTKYIIQTGIGKVSKKEPNLKLKIVESIDCTNKTKQTKKYTRLVKYLKIL